MSRAILNHCRGLGPGPHVCGCWVVDDEIRHELRVLMAADDARQPDAARRREN